MTSEKMSYVECRKELPGHLVNAVGRMRNAEYFYGTTHSAADHAARVSARSVAYNAIRSALSERDEKIAELENKAKVYCSAHLANQAVYIKVEQALKAQVAELQEALSERDEKVAELETQVQSLELAASNAQACRDEAVVDNNRLRSQFAELEKNQNARVSDAVTTWRDAAIHWMNEYDSLIARSAGLEMRIAQEERALRIAGEARGNLQTALDNWVRKFEAACKERDALAARLESLRDALGRE